MNATFRQYGFAIIFLGVGIYQLINRDALEASLYLLGAAAFVMNNLASSTKMAAYKKPLVIVTWALIAAVGILFLYMIQFKR
ncbi:hypothetical protein WBG78_02580 [Chryseolinea sp. T2]|uniref:hypothetical protein n=1 Tax=Chryseolinea sp. T2 TaxID=3129255 RepID=UPI003076D82C